MPIPFPNVNAVRRILIVDDNELGRLLTSLVLTDASYQVDCADDANSSRIALRTAAYDLVLVNLDMRCMDGGGLAALGQDRVSPLPPVLMGMSVRGRQARLDLPSDCGVETIIAKPFTASVLLHSIASALQASIPAPGGPEIWNRAPYLDLLRHLGSDRLDTALADLLALCDETLRIMSSPQSEEGSVVRKAHDLASVAGMLGFDVLSRACAESLAARDAMSHIEPLPRLEISLRRSMTVLASHLARVRSAAAA